MADSTWTELGCSDPGGGVVSTVDVTGPTSMAAVASFVTRPVIVTIQTSPPSLSPRNETFQDNPPPGQAGRVVVVARGAVVVGAGPDAVDEVDAAAEVVVDNVDVVVVVPPRPGKVTIGPVVVDGGPSDDAGGPSVVVDVVGDGPGVAEGEESEVADEPGATAINAAPRARSGNRARPNAIMTHPDSAMIDSSSARRQSART